MAAEEKQWTSERVDLWAHRHEGVVVVFGTKLSHWGCDVRAKGSCYNKLCIRSVGFMVVQFEDEAHAKNSPTRHVLL